MTRSRNRVLVAAAGASGCALSAQLFVLPCRQGRLPQQVASAAAPAQAAAVSSSSSSSALPIMGLSAACALLMSSSGSRAKKVGRNFFDFGGGGGSSYKSFDPATEAGVQDPVGFWDPLGLAADKDEATFKRRRSVEIKHGRIAMYATIGYIVPEYYKFPGSLSPSQGIKFSDVPNGLAAFSKVPFFGWLQIFAFAGFIETSGFFSGKASAIGFQKDSTVNGEPGNYGVGFPNFIGKVTDAEARASKLNAELANGRLAMVAVIGMFFQDGLTGAAWGDWALYTASPLRAASDKAVQDEDVDAETSRQIIVKRTLDEVLKSTSDDDSRSSKLVKRDIYKEVGITPAEVKAYWDRREESTKNNWDKVVAFAFVFVFFTLCAVAYSVYDSIVNPPDPESTLASMVGMD